MNTSTREGKSGKTAHPASESLLRNQPGIVYCISQGAGLVSTARIWQAQNKEQQTDAKGTQVLYEWLTQGKLMKLKNLRTSWKCRNRSCCKSNIIVFYKFHSNKIPNSVRAWLQEPLFWRAALLKSCHEQPAHQAYPPAKRALGSHHGFTKSVSIIQRKWEGRVRQVQKVIMLFF